MEMQFSNQTNVRARGVISNSASNWDRPVAVPAQSVELGKAAFDNRWVESNQLMQQAVPVNDDPLDVGQPTRTDRVSEQVQQGGGQRPQTLAPARVAVPPMSELRSLDTSVPMGQRQQPMPMAPPPPPLPATASEPMFDASFRNDSAMGGRAGGMGGMGGGYGTSDSSSVGPGGGMMGGDARSFSADPRSQQRPISMGQPVAVESAPMPMNPMQPGVTDPFSQLAEDNREWAGEQRSNDLTDLGYRTVPGLDMVIVDDEQKEEEAVTMISPLATRFASLDIDIPVDGQEFVFTSPRGEVELSARCYARSDVTRLRYLGLSLLILGVAIVVERFARRRLVK